MTWHWPFLAGFGLGVITGVLLLVWVVFRYAGPVMGNHVPRRKKRWPQPTEPPPKPPSPRPKPKADGASCTCDLSMSGGMDPATDPIFCPVHGNLS